MTLPDRRKIKKTVRSATDRESDASDPIEQQLPDAEADEPIASESDGSSPLEDADSGDGVDLVSGVDGGDVSVTQGDARLEEYQEELITRREATIAAARRRHGTAGAAIAAVGLQLQKMYEGKEDNEPAVIVEASSDPEDLDAEGINIDLDGDSYHAPPLERLDRQP